MQKIFQLLEPRQFNNMIKEYYRNKLKRKLAQMKEEGKTVSADSKVDHNYIMRQIVIRYMFRVSRLVIIIFSFSYFIGTLWYIFTWLIDDGVTTGYVHFFGYFKFREAKA